MSKRNWLYVIAGVGLALGFAAFIGLCLEPQKPNFAGDKGFQEQPANYHAGGPGCEPAAINRLSKLERQRKADACEDSKEQHRQATNSIIEARRAADAADASAVAAYQQARIAAWGMSASVLTFFAAAAAAIYAGLAVKEMRRIGETQVRAYMSFDKAEMKEDENGGARFRVALKNRGQSPAYADRHECRLVAIAASSDLCVERIRQCPEVVIGTGEEHSIWLEFGKAGIDKFDVSDIYIRLDFFYRDVFNIEMPPLRVFVVKNRNRPRDFWVYETDENTQKRIQEYPLTPPAT